MAVLTKKPGGSIEGEIKEAFDKERPKLLTTPMKRLLEGIALKGILEGLKEGGESDQIISNQIALFKRSCIAALEEAIVARINRVQDLSDVDRFLEVLDQEIDRTIIELPTRYPSITPFYIDEFEEKTHVDIWARLSMMTKEVSKEKREKVFNDCYQYLITTLKHLRGFWARGILAELREVLGVGMTPSLEKAMAIRTLKQDVTEMLTKLRISIERLHERAEQAIMGIRREEGVEVIANNEHNDIEEDVRVLKGTLTSADSRRWKDLFTQILTIREGDVSKKESLYAFLKHMEDEIISRLTLPIQRMTLGHIEGFNIASEIQRRLDRATMVLLAKRALPYLGLCGNLVSLHRPPNFLCGNDEEGMPNIKSLTDLE